MLNVLVTVSTTKLIPSVLLCGGFQLEQLKNSGLLDYRIMNGLTVTSSALNWADIVIFIRSVQDYDLRCMQEAKKAKKHLIYILDDDLINIPDRLSYKLSEEKKNNIFEMIKLSDVFLSPSRNLLAKYGKYSSEAARIEEPSVPCKTLERTDDSDLIKIGFAGSVDREWDLNEILEDVVDIIQKKYGDRVIFEFFGAKPVFLEKYGVKHIPYEKSYDAYREKMASLNWDIGLAPMTQYEFSKYKHYNKYIEYSTYRIAGVYTDCEPYIWAVKDRENGMLCRNTTESWVTAISELIDNQRLRETIAENSYNESKTIFSLDTVSKNYYEAITSGFEGKGTENISAWYEFVRLKYLFAHKMSSVKKYGIKTPIVAVKKIWKKIEHHENWNDNINEILKK